VVAPVRRLLLWVLSRIEWVFAPITAVAAIWMYAIRRAGVQRLPVNKKVLDAVGIFPIRRHYYEPAFEFSYLTHPLTDERRLPGIEMNYDRQVAELAKLRFGRELEAFPTDGDFKGTRFFFNNGNFVEGDAEIYYSLIRTLKPHNLIEIGSGFSTLIAVEAIRKNAEEDPAYNCTVTCIEPYQQPWLESLPVKVVRERVEAVDSALFSTLRDGDILFIDSSHVIRPQGDVVIEYLEILPGLADGVWIHVHDMFTPRDYLERWVRQEVRLWTEQYLVEAFLSHNSAFEIVLALNYLSHRNTDALGKACPVYWKRRYEAEPRSLWLKKRQRAASTEA
jgi:hypothetical protein